MRLVGFLPRAHRSPFEYLHRTRRPWVSANRSPTCRPAGVSALPEVTVSRGAIWPILRMRRLNVRFACCTSLPAMARTGKLDIGSAVKRSVEARYEWLAQQVSGRRSRLDWANGVFDVAFVRLDGTEGG